MASRDDLWKAWNDCVEKFGREPAMMALEQATGADDPSGVKDDQIDAAIKALKALLEKPEKPLTPRHVFGRRRPDHRPPCGKNCRPWPRRFMGTPDDYRQRS